MSFSLPPYSQGRFGVAIVGYIPSALPPFQSPFSGSSASSEFMAILPSACLMAVVSYVQV